MIESLRDEFELPDNAIVSQNTPPSAIDQSESNVWEPSTSQMNSHAAVIDGADLPSQHMNSFQSFSCSGIDPDEYAEIKQDHDDTDDDLKDIALQQTGISGPFMVDLFRFFHPQRKAAFTCWSD